MTTLSADEFVRYLSWIIFGALFVHATWQLIRHPGRIQLDITLLFGMAAVVIIFATLQAAGLIEIGSLSISIISTALLLLPYLLFRLIDDMIGVRPLLARPVLAGELASIAIVWLLPVGRAPWLDMLLLGYMVAVLSYVVARGAAVALRGRGVTKRRLMAVTVGTLFLVFNFVTGTIPRWFPSSAEVIGIIADLLGLAAGISYYLGFATPGWLRRAWQEPELRAILERAARLPRLPDTPTIVRALEEGSAISLGAPKASIGVWSNHTQTLRFNVDGALVDIAADSPLTIAHIFRQQAAVFVEERQTNGMVETIAHLDGTYAMLGVPITAGDQRLGVLAVFAPRAPIFADDDLALLQLLGDQAAVILESRRLIDEASSVRAREEAARLKEDFLSAAAHDLKTPLTTLVAQAQLIERRLDRDPERPVDRAGIRRIVVESERLRTMVLELLDAARTEQGQLLSTRELVDIVSLGREVARRYHNDHHPCRVSAQESIVGVYDVRRIEQLLENLIENAIKYSPNGGAIELRFEQKQGSAILRVSDHGIGVPPDDLPYLFNRFHRGTNVDDRSFPGMGLGLYICRGIVEEHGGHIRAESRLGSGTTFHVTLPMVVLPANRTN
jgi:signal transduction histidine kinase